MSSLFTQINQISQEAQQQRAMSNQQPAKETDPTDSPTPTSHPDQQTDKTPVSENSAPTAKTAQTKSPTSVIPQPESVTSPSDVTTSQTDVTVKKRKSKTRTESREEGVLGKGSRVDMDKLRTVIEQIAAVKTGPYGFSVRMSQQEQADIEDFIADTLRKEGLKGHEVSIAKLMRYTMRYMFRVHPEEFVTALRAALQVEETLSI